MSMTQCLKLSRIVEEFCERRVEEEDDNGNVRTRTEFYWEHKSSFGVNSGDTNYAQSKDFYAQNALLGGYTITQKSIEHMKDIQSYQLSHANVNTLTQQISKTFSGCKKTNVSGNHVIIRMSESTDIDKPGDFRIHWNYIPADKEYTIVAQ